MPRRSKFANSRPDLGPLDQYGRSKLSTADNYRIPVKSLGSDLRGMVQAYGLDFVCVLARQLNKDMSPEEANKLATNWYAYRKLHPTAEYHTYRRQCKAIDDMMA